MKNVIFIKKIILCLINKIIALIGGFMNIEIIDRAFKGGK